MLKLQVLKFLVVGGLNTLFGYSIYAFFVWCGLSYTLSLLLSTILGVAFNFHTIGRLVFNRNDPSLIFRFVFVYVVLFFLNLCLVKLFLIFGLSAYIAGALAIGLAAIAAFILNKYFVFKR